MRQEHTRRLAVGTALLALLLLPGPVTLAAPPMSGKTPIAGQQPATATDAEAELASAGRAIESGQYQQAVDALNQAIAGGSLSKDNLALAYHHRGIARQKLGLQSSALDDYTKAIDLGTLPRPIAARAHYNRAISLAAAGDTFAAERDYSKAIELAPDYAAAYHNRANIERERNDYPTAIRDYSAAIERLGDDKRKLPLFGRALAYEKSGDLASAVADLNRVLVLDPAYAAARTKLQELGPQLAAMPQTPDRQPGGVIKVASAGGWDTTAIRAGQRETSPAIRQDVTQPAPQKTAMLAERPHTQATSADGRYRMQLGAFRKADSASKAWRDMAHREAALSGLDHSIEVADLGAKGTYYRLQAGGFRTASEAKARCTKLAAENIACVVVER